MRDEGELTAWEIKEREEKRERTRELYARAPIQSLLFLTAAVVLSAIYRPAVDFALVYFGSALGLGVIAARLGVSRYWTAAEYLSLPSLFFLFMILRGFYHTGTPWQSLAITSWMFFGIRVPFCIWRKEALALARSANVP
ncbi:MAG: hypothetical protein ACO1QR_05440 [Chthoniobacteraceae bacterium]